MFGRSFHLFSLFGFSVRLDLSWLVIAMLVTWSLAATVFPQQYPDLSGTTYWLMGLAGMLGLFVSIVLHELSHSLAARRFGLPMRSITLFIFGGVAEMDDEPPSPRAEFVIAIAGPIASILIAAACLVVAWVGQLANWPDAVNGVFGWLALINTVLVLFNMVPAFPLDGGRVLRSALWHWQGSIRRATRITSAIGTAFGILLIMAGALLFIGGNPIGGMWYFLIGLFLRSAAQMSYRQLVVRRALEGESVHRFMNRQPVAVPPQMTIQELVQNYIYRYHHKLFPVVTNGRLEGCVTTRDVRQVPQADWESKTVGDILQECSESNAIEENADAMQALSRMSRAGASRMVVVDRDRRLVGMLSLKDMMRFLSLKIELEGEDGAGTQHL